MSIGEEWLVLHGVIRADFTILLILFYVSCISGLMPVSETSKISANQPKKPAPMIPLHPLFFFFLKKEDAMGFGVPLNFLWPCLCCDEQ